MRDRERRVRDVVDARGGGLRGEVGGELRGAVGFAGAGVAGYDDELGEKGLAVMGWRRGEGGRTGIVAVGMCAGDYRDSRGGRC